MMLCDMFPQIQHVQVALYNMFLYSSVTCSTWVLGFTKICPIFEWLVFKWTVNGCNILVIVDHQQRIEFIQLGLENALKNVAKCYTRAKLYSSFCKQEIFIII